MTFKSLKDYIVIFIGTMIVGFGIVNFSIRYGLTDGGFTGINLIIYREFGISVWLVNLVLNIPGLILLYKMFDLSTTIKTVYGVAALTLSIAIWEQVGFILPYFTDDMIVVSILYGTILGLGVAIVLKFNGTTGGAVLVVKLLNKKFGVPIPRGLLLWDISVITLGAIHQANFTIAIWTMIGIFVYTVVVSKVQEGGLFGYKVLIISEQHEAISTAVLTTLNRGATLLQGTGVHSGNTRNILLVVISKRELSQMKTLLKEIDPNAFITVSHTYETIGEGFSYPQMTSN